MSCDLIDISSSDEFICISDEDENDSTKKENERSELQTEDDESKDLETSTLKSPKSSTQKSCANVNDAVFQKGSMIINNLERKRNMGSSTVKPVKPLKFKTWSQVKTEREKEKQMPKLDREQVWTVESSSESDIEDELPDLDDYSEVICISDEECKTDNHLTISEDFSNFSRSRNYSTSTDDEDVTVIRVTIIESDSNKDENEDMYLSPKCKRRKLSGSRSQSPETEQESWKSDISDFSHETEDENMKSDVKSETIKKVFDKRSQDKLTNILNEMKSSGSFKFKNVTSNKSSVSHNEQVSESVSNSNDNEAASLRSRHFMDSLIDLDNEYSDTELPAQKKPRKRCKMRRVVRKACEEHAHVQGQITSYFNIKKDNHKKCFWQRHNSKLSNSKIENEIEHLTGEFSQVQINTVEGCWEDEQNTGFMRHGLQFLLDFSHKKHPPAELVQQVIQEGIVSCKSEELMRDSYNCLMVLYEKFPDILQLDFGVLQDTLELLNFGKSFSNQDSLLVLKTVYILRLIILCFEDEMITKNISDPKIMRQTLGYKALSYDCSFNNVKELVNYIVYCLTNEQTFNNEIPEILPLLQRLLHISVEVSSNTNAAAKAIASELMKSYSYLPSVEHKKLLVQTLESNLLRYFLVSLVLERQCEETVPCYDFPNNLQDVFSCFFRARPPTNISTPPTTPQSDDESLNIPAVSTAGYPAIYVEELLMLLFEVLQCYVQCSQDNSPATLRRRAYMRRENFVHSMTELEKDTILRQVEDLRVHVLTLTPEMTPASEQYLSMMLCVIDWQRTTTVQD